MLCKVSDFGLSRELHAKDDQEPEDYETQVHSQVFQLKPPKTTTTWPTPSWLDSSVARALHRYCRGGGFESRSIASLNFFRLYFHDGLRCVYNCDDQSCLHIFLRSSNIQSSIYSLADIIVISVLNCCKAVKNLEKTLHLSAYIKRRKRKKKRGNMEVLTKIMR